jgi:hypothetical protein
MTKDELMGKVAHLINDWSVECCACQGYFDNCETCCTERATAIVNLVKGEEEKG